MSHPPHGSGSRLALCTFEYGQSRSLHIVIVLLLSLLFSTRMIAQSCTVNISTNPSSPVPAGQSITVNATVTSGLRNTGGDPLSATLNYDGASICSFSDSDGCSTIINPGAVGTHFFDWTCMDGFTGESNSGSQSLDVGTGSGGGTGPTQGFLPKYLVVSLLYPPPGNQSNVSFTDSVSNSVTITFSQMFSVGTSLQFVITPDTPTGPGPAIPIQPTIGITGSTTNSAAFNVTVAGAEGSTASSHVDFVDHYQDVFYVWLNPLILVTQTGPNAGTFTVTTPVGADGNREPVDVIAVSVADLLNPAQIPSAKMQPIPIGNGVTVPGLGSICANPAQCTIADFAAILSQDPLIFPFGSSNPNESPLDANTPGNPNRFVPITTPELLFLDPSVQNTFTLTDSAAATSSVASSQQESVGFSISNSSGVIQTGIVPDFSLNLTSTSTLNFTESVQLDVSTTVSHQEQVTLGTTTSGCFEAIDVFEDTLFHSFVLVPPGASPSACGFPEANFQVSAIPSLQAVNAGSSTSYTVAVTGEFGFTDPEFLSVTGLPSGALAAFVPSTTQGTGSARLNIATSLSTPPGDYTLTISGTGDAITQRTTVLLRVGNFSLSANAPTTQTVAPTQAATYSIKVTPLNLFDSDVQLSVTGLPPGVSSSACLFTPNPVTGSSLAFGSQSSTLTCTIPNGTPTGSYTLTVTGISGNITQSTTVVLNVNDFSVSASPASQTIIANGSASYSITITGSGGFTGPVNLSVSGLPTGTTASFSPTSVPGSGTSALTINTTSATPAGNYTLTLTGTSGSVVHSTSVNLSIQSFTLSVTPGSLTVNQGDPATFTATITYQNGFSGTVSLVEVVGNLATRRFNPPSLTGSGSSVLTIPTSTLPIGSFTIFAVATSGNLTQSQPFSLTVTNFHLTVTPSSQTISAGTNTAYQVTLTPSAGFSGSVSLKATGLPSGATPVFSPASISSSGSSTLTISTANSLAAGTYPFTITGTEGSLSVTVSATLVVTAPVGDFTLSASPSSQTINAGDSASISVAVSALSGFTGNVSLDVSGLPGDAFASFSPASINGSGSSLLSISSGTSTGSFFVTITGTSGSLSHSATVTLNINAPPDPCAGGGLGGRGTQPCLQQ